MKDENVLTPLYKLRMLNIVSTVFFSNSWNSMFCSTGAEENTVGSYSLLKMNSYSNDCDIIRLLLIYIYKKKIDKSDKKKIFTIIRELRVRSK
jgi:hypothetical protein